MRTVGSHRFFLDPLEKETLVARMTKDGRVGGEVEEGEISSDSVEEISEEDFKQQDFPSRPSGRSGRSWMGDPRQYAILQRNYASNLYNFAWAQAVQNKPLGNFMFEEVTPGGKPGSEEPAGVPAKEDICNVMDSSEESNGQEEKEEGELEEGEIEMGSFEVGFTDEVAGERLDNVEEKTLASAGVVPPLGPVAEESTASLHSEEEKESEVIEDFDALVASVLEELETITEEEAEKSFEAGCFTLRKTLDSLHRMMSGSQLPVLDALVQQAFEGIQTVHSVYLKRKDQNKEALLRLLIHITNKVHALFTPEQMKEMNEMVQSVVPDPLERKMDNKPQLESTLLVSAGNISGQNDDRVIAKLPKLDTSFLPKIKADYHPLLDPHANHDEDSLPSPTHASAPSSPRPAHVSEPAPVISEQTSWKREETEDVTLPSHEVDSVTISSYQQRYLHASFLPCNELPSPTPSEEGNDDGGDFQEEVSNSVVNSLTSLCSSTSIPNVGCSSKAAHTDSSFAEGSVSSKAIEQTGPGMKMTLRASAKNRDPRLKLANHEMSSALDLCKQQTVSVDNNAARNVLTEALAENSRKHKFIDEAVPDNQILKKQRNDLSNSREAHIPLGKGGWLVDNGALVDQSSHRGQPVEDRGLENRKIDIAEGGSTRGQTTNLTSANEQAPVMSSPPGLSLPSLLKDLAGNPTMFVHLIKEQQRLAAEAQQKAVSPVPVTVQPSSTSTSPETVLSFKSETSCFPDSDKKPVEKLQISSQTIPTNNNDAGRIRMKPRDPRRILHSNMVQKTESSGPDQLKANGVHPLGFQRAKDPLATREQGQQAQITPMLSQSSPLPDIARQFTKNLKNLANMMSTSQVPNQTPTVQNALQPVSTRVDEMDARPAISDSNDQQSTSGANGGSTNMPQSCNPWGNVDHLLDGYDDQQKAAIQMERARRIEEQNRMFAVRKLCLVLDLDHTLLNSAKFIEVDQIHEEILRKKEEQDREKPKRSLFRFSHMGMWTKLRPGIWNFLEKASKLYELHLYTMGNKLYATEMAKVLDPTGALFSGRVISKGDEGDPYDADDRAPKSKDLDGVLGMESAVVIIDDSARVWPHHKLNLIVVERYTYFPCSRRQFGLPGPSLLEIDHDERLEDGTLASALAVIERIHQNFFSHHCLSDVDVRNILASEQRKILSGCRIVFSRIFPVGEANPHLHPLWQTAEQFGAVCTNQIDDQVTHVVANSLGTDKVNWALSTGRFVVHPGWVEASALLYRRASEQDFAVKLQII
ncbi:hypothetical protein Taro_054831 [Colocasia esculenta]|uniref:protein-serine/threonine phosphatase n=1 Tax=Colocasia esculenta TaxID=4460 RepID=A0A843XR62_COLES|nr:hypothetical protein [Colocasia esculenta]